MNYREHLFPVAIDLLLDREGRLNGISESELRTPDRGAVRGQFLLVVDTGGGSSVVSDPSDVENVAEGHVVASRCAAVGAAPERERRRQAFAHAHGAVRRWTVTRSGLMSANRAAKRSADEGEMRLSIGPADSEPAVAAAHRQHDRRVPGAAPPLHRVHR